MNKKQDKEVASDLVTEDALPYASNEEREITRWYMSDAPRTHCNNFNTFITTINTQDSVPYDQSQLGTMFVQSEVWVNDQVTMQLYGRQPAETITTVDATDSQFWQTPAQAVPQRPLIHHPLNIVLGDNQVALLGYDLETGATGQILVTLYWQALAPFAENYQTFVHLYNGELIAQHDGTPDCGNMPTGRWEPGQIITDSHLVQLPEEARGSDLAIYAGMYALLTSERLTVPDNVNNLVNLTTIDGER